jgi:mRNA-degrading endonuclease RelE of RelBE toxin-antitoxin system
MKAFSVITTPLFNRLLAKLSPEHPELPGILETAIGILKADPYNINRGHPIRKLRDVKPGEGQFRLRIARWRFRYDIWDKRREVELSYCGLRREDTYR